MAPSHLSLLELSFALLLLASGVSAGPTAEEKVDLILNAFKALGGGDAGKFVSAFADDHVYTLEGGAALPWTGIFKGPDAVLQAVGIFSQYANFTFKDDLDLFVSSQTGRLVAQYTLAGVGLQTGKRFEEPCFVRFVVNDNLKVAETLETCNGLRELTALIPNNEREKKMCFTKAY